MTTTPALEIATQAPSTASATRSRVPVALLSAAACIIIMNIFAPQMMVGDIASSFGLRASLGGFIAMISFLGYATGLFVLVPLSDLFENRLLILLTLSGAIAASIGIAVAPNALVLFPLLFALGAVCSVIQMFVPAAVAMTSPENRGRVIGDLMSGLMLGILLSRPAASYLAGTWGWRSFYVASAASMTLLAIAMAVRMPERHMAPTTTYGQLLKSLWHFFVTEPVLRHRAISAAIMMAAFNLFWTTIAYVLRGGSYHFDQKKIAAFALVGVGGAIITPLAGRWADKGWGKQVTSLAHMTMIAGFGLAALCGFATNSPIYVPLGGLGISAIMLDMGVLGDQVIGRHMINQLNPEARGRINAVFVGLFFIGGAIGSALSGILWESGGWGAICAGGALLGALAVAARKWSRM